MPEEPSLPAYQPIAGRTCAGKAGADLHREIRWECAWGHFRVEWRQPPDQKRMWLRNRRETCLKGLPALEIRSVQARRRTGRSIDDRTLALDSIGKIGPSPNLKPQSQFDPALTFDFATDKIDETQDIIRRTVRFDDDVIGVSDRNFRSADS